MYINGCLYNFQINAMKISNNLHAVRKLENDQISCSNSSQQQKINHPKWVPSMICNFCIVPIEYRFWWEKHVLGNRSFVAGCYFSVRVGCSQHFLTVRKICYCRFTHRASDMLEHHRGFFSHFLNLGGYTLTSSQVLVHLVYKRALFRCLSLHHIPYCFCK